MSAERDRTECTIPPSSSKFTLTRGRRIGCDRRFLSNASRHTIGSSYLSWPADPTICCRKLDFCRCRARSSKTVSAAPKRVTGGFRLPLASANMESSDLSRLSSPILDETPRARLISSAVPTPKQANGILPAKRLQMLHQARAGTRSYSPVPHCQPEHNWIGNNVSQMKSQNEPGS